MKPLIIIALFAFILGIATEKIIHRHHHKHKAAVLVKAKNPFDKGRPTFPKYWAEKKTFFNTFAKKADIVMIGDSLTDGAEWAEMFPNTRIANRAIGGDTTAGLLERLDGIYLVKPKKAFLMIGINDLLTGEDVDKIIANYSKIVDELKSHNIHVYIESTLFCNPKLAAAWSNCADNNKKVEIINQRISAMGDFIDLNASLSDKNGLKAEYTNDGIHLMANGYLVWEEAIKDHIH